MNKSVSSVDGIVSIRPCAIVFTVFILVLWGLILYNKNVEYDFSSGASNVALGICDPLQEISLNGSRSEMILLVTTHPSKSGPFCSRVLIGLTVRCQAPGGGYAKPITPTLLIDEKNGI